MGRPGAIVLVIYELLQRESLITFTPEQIVNLYAEYKEDDIIKNILKWYKKGGNEDDIKTLNDVNALKKWLDKHVSFKEVFWFEKDKEKGIYKFDEEKVNKYKLKELINKIKNDAV